MSKLTSSRMRALGGLVLLGGLVAAARPAAAEDPPPSAPDLESRARRLHDDAIVIDTHSDTTPRFEDPDWRFLDRHDAGHMDLPRIREGGLDVQFWSIYMGEREGDGRAIREALERIDAVHELVRRHPDELALAATVAEIRAAVAQGKLVSLMGVEGGHIIEGRLAVLRSFHRLGVRYMTLTHSFHTGWGDSSGTGATALEPLHGGLTGFGREVVREMNRLGMLVDVSHVSDATFADALEASAAPVIASHSSCRAVADHPRNLSDRMLRALAAQGGVVMINFYPGYIDERASEEIRAHRARLGPELDRLRERLGDDSAALRSARRELFERNPFPQSSLESLLAHFDHALAVAGPDHVGIGADWDGVPSLPRGMDDVSKLPTLTLRLLERGHSEDTVRKVLGENLLRVMAEAERVAREMSGADAERAAQAPVR